MKTLSDFARSIRYAGLVTLIAATSAVQACSSDTIVAAHSSVTRPGAKFSPEPTQLRASGTVTSDEGVPVAGVKVTVYRWPAGGAASSAVTDSRGFYSISFLTADGIAALTEKDGYESKWHSRSISTRADFQFDLRIHRAGR